MSKKTSLMFIMLLAIGGMALSGYLSYYNLWGNGCSESVISCGAAPIEIFGLPNCVYGFFMYLAVFIISLLAMRKTNKRLFGSLIILGVVGTLFAGGLTYYELYILDNAGGSIPACAYGTILYILILAFSVMGRQSALLATEAQQDGST